MWLKRKSGEAYLKVEQELKTRKNATIKRREVTRVGEA